MQTDDKLEDVRRKYEKKLKRRNRYEKQKEYTSGVIYFGSENDFGFSNAVYQQWLTQEAENRSYQALYEALDDLRRIDPAGHKLIIEYFFGGAKVTYTEIGRMYGISRQACTKKIKKCLCKLKVLVNLHKDTF